MISRVCLVAVLLAGSFLAGCGSCRCVGLEPPRFKVCNGGRIVDEFRWLYADIQDTIFGVDYNYDMDHEFDTDPY